MFLNAVLIVVFLVAVAMLWNEGLWSNTTSLINVVFAGLLATNYFEPAATFMDEQFPSLTYLWDFVCIWLIFVVSYGLLRSCTDELSRMQVRFKMPVEQTGRIVSCLAIGWVLVCFTTTTLHVAPLALHHLRGSFQETPTSNNFFGIGPDQLWLGFVQGRSRGALATPDDTARSSQPGDNGKRVFDPESEFILRYGARRLQFESVVGYQIES